jgi:hypothetical protein
MSVEPCGSTEAPCLKEEELRELLWGNMGACLSVRWGPGAAANALTLSSWWF